MMMNKSMLIRFGFCLIFILYINITTVRSYGKQGEALQRLFDQKLRARAGGDGKRIMDTTTSSSSLLYDEEDETRLLGGHRRVVVLPQEGLREKDKIEKLPGQPTSNIGVFNQYGGYVTVDQEAGQALYYYFAEADQTSKNSKPLLLWLNGGPGCSSLAYGAMQELGPFRVHSDGKTLYHNPYAWNNVANVLFLESPAGVGFSYSNRTLDYNLSGDKMTAEDNYVFLVNWLERFPEYKNREFYISGESYAGHYVPQLAHTILKHNKIANDMKNKNINLKGIIIGNAVINDETDQRGMFDYFWSHALLSDQAFFNIRKYCDFSPNATSQHDQCNNAVDEANDDISFVDIYNIYAPMCFSNSLTDEPKKQTSATSFDPCSDNYVHAYLNTPEVQKALHANLTKLNYTWEPCSDILKTWADSPSSIIPLLKEFMANGLRVWVFSGDTDGRVPVTSTRYSLNKMKLPLKKSWYPWFHEQEVGGYTMVYKGDLTFATVRGAGHQVPSYQPIRALALIKHFLDGKPLPKFPI